MEAVKYDSLTWQEKRDVRNTYVDVQRGKCWFCGSHLSGPPAKDVPASVNKKLFPPNFFKYPVHLHHDHKTGLTIGAVHNHCNAVLWQYFGE